MPTKTTRNEVQKLIDTKRKAYFERILKTRILVNLLLEGFKIFRPYFENPISSVTCHENGKSANSDTKDIT